MRGQVIHLLWLMAMLLSGCANSPPVADVTGPGRAAVEHARGVIGVPYRYGGESVSSGFDCSGLVYYAYRKAGLRVPRTTDQQLRALQPVGRFELQPGDLLFFRINDKGWHVGLYAGDNQFIHAPSSGKTVSVASLDNPYWRRTLYQMGRMY